MATDHRPQTDIPDDDGRVRAAGSAASPPSYRSPDLAQDRCAQVAEIVARARKQTDRTPAQWFRLGGLDPTRDFATADLTGLDLSHIDWRAADLREANLTRADLFAADLRGADARRVRLSFARLEGGRFDDARFLESTLRGADLRDAVFSGADLRDTRLTGAMLLGADLRQALLDPGLEDLPDLLIRPRRLLGPWAGLDAVDREDRPADSDGLARHDPDQDDETGRPIGDGGRWDRYTQTPLPQPESVDGTAQSPFDADTLPPVALRMVLDAIAHCLSLAVIYWNAGFAPWRLGAAEVRDPFLSFVLHSTADMAALVSYRRQEMALERQRDRRAGKPYSEGEAMLAGAGFFVLERDYEGAAQHLDEAKSHFERLRRPDLVAEVYARLGCMALQQQDHLRALRTFRRALDLFGECRHREGQARQFLSIALLGLAVGEKTAANFLTKSLQIDHQPDRDRLKLRQAVAAGIFALKLGDRDSALSAWESARRQIPDHANDARLFERVLAMTERLPDDCANALIEI